MDGLPLTPALVLDSCRQGHEGSRGEYVPSHNSCAALFTLLLAISLLSAGSAFWPAPARRACHTAGNTRSDARLFHCFVQAAGGWHSLEIPVAHLIRMFDKACRHEEGLPEPVLMETALNDTLSAMSRYEPCLEELRRCDRFFGMLSACVL